MLRSRRQRGENRRALSLYFATDIHGSGVCFRKFLAAAKVYQADAVILGGDFAGKALVPVLARDGDLTARIEGQSVTMPAAEWDRMAVDINRAGFYPVRMEAGELAALEADPAALDRLFRSEIAAQLQRWCDLAAERLDPAVRCIITPGNDDPMEADAVLAAHPRDEGPEGELSDLEPPHRYRMAVEGSGGPGFVRGEAGMQMSDVDGGTRVSYDADVQVGGLIASVGQRMLGGVTKMMLDQFFNRMTELLTAQKA
jgi:Icc-related predicted phosphoesterase